MIKKYPQDTFEIKIPSAGEILLQDLLNLVHGQERRMYEVTLRFYGQTVIKGREIKELNIIKSHFSEVLPASEEVSNLP